MPFPHCLTTQPCWLQALHAWQLHSWALVPLHAGKSVHCVGLKLFGTTKGLPQFAGTTDGCTTPAGETNDASTVVPRGRNTTVQPGCSVSISAKRSRREAWSSGMAAMLPA
jgi:hypothetical protein